MGEEPGTIDFSKAHYEDGDLGIARCALCGQAIEDAYFTVDGAHACSRCADNSRRRQEPWGGAGRALRATAFGMAGGAAGAAIWYAVAALFKLEIGLIAILVGWLVGNGVRRGSGGRGGLGYQALAAFLAYASIVTTYVPEIYRAFEEKDGSSDSVTAAVEARGPAAPKAAPGSPALGPLAAVAALGLGVVLVYTIAFAAPFLGGLDNAIGLLIIFFALQQAWSLNRKVVIDVQGPFRIAKSDGGPGGSGGEGGESLTRPA